MSLGCTHGMMHEKTAVVQVRGDQHLPIKFLQFHTMSKSL